MANKLTRRSLLGAGIGLGILAYLRPGDQGRNHNRYFAALSGALDRASYSGPTLVIDRQKLDQNISTLKGHIDARFDYRIVAKSLPSLPLLARIMSQTDSNRLMLFHQPFLNQVVSNMPGSDILMGKPMPVAAARKFYQLHETGGAFDPARQLQWLIDSPDRLAQYKTLAEQLKLPMRINIELDVGLHRGGVRTDEELAQMLKMIGANQYLKFSGFMGYEPHIAKLPGDTMGYRDDAMETYKSYVRLAENQLGKSLQGHCLNSGGSPTYQYYDEGAFPQNELSAGSCLVKPADFDLSSLADHVPASYIASPVLKSLSRSELPGIDGIGNAMAAWNPNRQQTFFTYGGYWKAKPVSPEGLVYNPLFGRSTNQEMYNGSRQINLSPDDWIFLRPNQSEFVFLQFGNIAVFDGEDIVESWPVFSG